MKFLTIVTLLLLIHVCGGILNVVNLYNGNLVVDEESLQEIQNDVVVGQSYITNPVSEDTSTNLGFGDFFKGLLVFIKTIWWGVISVKGTLTSLGVPEEIARWIGYIIYFIYGIAIANYISNRSTKGMN